VLLPFRHAHVSMFGGRTAYVSMVFLHAGIYELVGLISMELGL
jgi:hypothetical protein